MIHGKTLTELAMELDRQQTAKADYVADTREMILTPDTSNLIINGVDDNQPLAVNELAHEQIAYRTDIPKKYYMRMREESPALLAGNVNHWFKESPHRRMVRTLDGNARAFLSDRYRRIDNFPVAQTALETLMSNGNQFEIVSSDVTDTNLYIQARLPKLEGEVKVGDPVQAGVIIRNSEVGKGALDVSPMLYRLVCTNGMVTGKAINDGRMRRTHLGSKVFSDDNNIIYQDDTLKSLDEALMLQIRDAIKQLSDPALFMQLMDRMRQSTQGATIQQPVKAVEVLAKTLQLQQKESDGILESLIRSQDYSRWGLLNAVTAQANTHHSYDRAIELETMGGVILDMPASSWKQIAEAA